MWSAPEVFAEKDGSAGARSSRAHVSSEVKLMGR